MEQLSFSDLETSLRRKTRKTRTERLTERLEKLVPWSDLLALIQPFYYESGRRGRIRCHTNFRHPFNLSWSGKTCDIRRSSKTTS